MCAGGFLFDGSSLTHKRQTKSHGFLQKRRLHIYAQAKFWCSFCKLLNFKTLRSGFQKFNF